MTYVMSDIHGNLRRFRSVMRQIDLRPSDTLYVLGDVIDRYPDGIRILRELMAMPNVRMIPGNHEHMMLNALDTPLDDKDNVSFYLRRDRLSLWYRNGGRVTHDYLKHIRKDTRAAIFAYLRALPLQADIEIGGVQYRLIHGGDLNDYGRYGYKYEDETSYAVWHRRSGQEPPSKDYVVIFGHTPTLHYQNDQPLRIWHGNRQIGIDCGSGYPETPDIWGRQFYGRLSCLRLDDMREYYSEEQYEEDRATATERLMSELEKGKRSGAVQGYSPLKQAAAEVSETE